MYSEHIKVLRGLEDRYEMLIRALPKKRWRPSERIMALLDYQNKRDAIRAAVEALEDKERE